jgi:eukaryotic-like serine/threonine-protein kinase
MRSVGAAPVRLGPYTLLERIASGGMASVYLAEQRGAHGFVREVAVKIAHPHLAEQPRFASDLIEEAKLAARICHNNVVQVLDVGEEDGNVFLVMEYVEGESLAGLLGWCVKNDRRLPFGVAFRILLDALAGLHAAHELRDEAGASLNLVHRDFSPQNILVGVDGLARLGDFGVAKAGSRVGYTTTGVVKGKTAYLAPEQLRGQPLDRRADIWAAGVVAWEVFARRRLFTADNEAELLLKLVSERPRRLRSVCPDVPEALDDAIAEALEPHVEERVPDAAAFAARLRAAAATFCEVAEVTDVASWVADTALPARTRRRDARSDVRSSAATRDAGSAGPPLAASMSVDAQTRRDRGAPARGGTSRVAVALVAVGVVGVTAGGAALVHGARTPGAEVERGASSAVVASAEVAKVSPIAAATGGAPAPSAEPSTSGSADPVAPTASAEGAPASAPTQAAGRARYPARPAAPARPSAPVVRPRALPPNPYAK